MTHDEIKLIPRTQTITYARVVVDFCPQKANLHRICITAGGNLINYPGELSMCTANLNTSKLVLSTDGAKYICLDIKNFYLLMPFDRYEYMKILLTLFPEWIIGQYQLRVHALNGFVYLEMQRAVGDCPRRAFLPINSSANGYSPTGIMNVPTRPVFGNTSGGLYHSLWLSTTLGLSTLVRNM